MRVALVPGPGRGGLLCPLHGDGSPQGAPVRVTDAVAAVAEREKAGTVRWVWPSAAAAYPRLLRAGLRVARCHDAELTERLLLAADLRAGQPAGLAVAAARLANRPAPSTNRSRAGPQGGGPGAPTQLMLDEHAPAKQADQTLADLIAVHAHQLRRIGADQGLAILVAAESAGGLAAAEMAAAGLPWRADIHDQVLSELLGPRTAGAARPARLAELAAQITAALGAVRPVNPDSPPQLLRALAASGIRVPSTRASVLRSVGHPAIPLLLRYKELARLYTANGWSWLDAWVSDGRFRPEYVVGGVVSGRWATRGGGALQIPRVLRRAVVADPGWKLVVADAAQLEPRVLAALAGDGALARSAASGDLYGAVAGLLGTGRDSAKVALLSVMYGGTGGASGQTLALFRRRFGQASAFVEAAARAGEEGRVVRSALGRTCPPPSADFLSVTGQVGEPGLAGAPRASQAARARGRFTRNFVVQASAADWALVLLAALRLRLAGPGAADGQPHLVFFQHDEVIVHCPGGLADEAVAAIRSAAQTATRLVFGVTEVSFPMKTAVVDCYADAK